jgi:hypothetical protein
MSSDNPTFAEIAEENIRQYRKKPMTEKEQLIEWEKKEEQEEYQDALRVVEKDLWVNDDGSV